MIFQKNYKCVPVGIIRKTKSKGNCLGFLYKKSGLSTALGSTNLITKYTKIFFNLAEVEEIKQITFLLLPPAKLNAFFKSSNLLNRCHSLSFFKTNTFTLKVFFSIMTRRITFIIKPTLVRFKRCD